MMMVLNRRGAAGAVAAVALLLAASPAHAANGAGAPAVRTMSNFPHGYMEYSLPPSAQVGDSIRVGNDGDTAGAFNLVAVDGFTSSLSGVVYGDAGNALHDGLPGNGEYGAGTWITLERPRLTLAPGQQTTVAYTLHVPPGTHAGDYVGGISAENPTPTSAPRSGQGVGLNITQRTVIAVVVHVPGQLTAPTFAVGKPSILVENQRRQVITFPLTYGGDTLIKPHLVFSILGASGAVLLHFDEKLDTFVPHTTIQFPFPVDRTTLVPGTYRISGGFGGSVDSPFTASITVSSAAAAVLAPEQGSGRPAQAVTAQTPEWARPALFGLGGLVFLALVAPLLIRWRRTCSHCAKHMIRGLIPVEDFGEIADCRSCRDRALERERVKLCRGCYLPHVLAAREGPASAGRSSQASA
ncbi:MAG TPA: hypothetical protein VIO13_02030 [Candidatus Dormibacteraeota bacterium]